jgi:uncharacterized protein
VTGTAGLSAADQLPGRNQALKRSRYVLISDQTYRNEAGRVVKFVYATRRASLFSMDAALADRFERGDLAGLGQERLRHLERLEAVVPEDQDELGAVLGALRAGSADPGARGFTIMPTSYCNMACDYCGQEHYKSAVSKARVEALAARVEATINAEATRHVGVTWFGGEPLLALRVVRELSNRFTAAADAAGKGYSAKMATNGSLLTARTLRLLHEECRVRNVEITIDGPRDVHNRRRIKRNGTGSFDHIMSVLSQAVREQTVPGMHISIRMNVDSENEDTVAELITELARAGLASPQIALDLMPVHSWGNDVSAVEMEARRYAALEAEWLRLAGASGIRFSTLPTEPKATTCLATSVHHELDDSQGRVYACSEHPLVPGVRDTGIVAQITDLTGATPRPTGMYDDWFDQVEGGQQQCGRCPILPVCGGSCPKLWREGHLPCPSVKFNWRDRMDIAARNLGYVPVEPV